MSSPKLIRMSYFIWMLVPVMIWVGYKHYGLPHFIWSYSWVNEGQGYDPFAKRWYTRCTHVGPYGEYTASAINGKCKLVKFVKAEGSV